MKCIYEAATSLDAHMILNLLQHQGVEGRVDGDYLQGGVGELQAVNIVRVMVSEADAEKAKQIINDWEAKSVEPTQITKQKSSGAVTGFLLGLIIGGGVIAWTYNSPVTDDGIDYNGDGKLDERWIYKDYRLDRTEIDRNLDGKVDQVYYMDRYGSTVKAKSDDDFDGTFETRSRFRQGVIYSMESDINQDGVVDHISTFKLGNLETNEILGQGQDTRKKRQIYDMWKLVSAEMDTDGDGEYDTVIEYDYFEDESRRSSDLQNKK